MPRPSRKPWRKSWKVMEDVRRRFKISATTFHITSMRPMPHLGISTIACHTASSASFSYWNAV